MGGGGEMERNWDEVGETKIRIYYEKNSAFSKREKKSIVVTEEMMFLLIITLSKG